MNQQVVTLARDAVKTARGSGQEVEVFSEEEVEKILFYIQDEKNASIRDKMIVYMLLYTGVRVSELVSIKLRDIDFFTRELRIIGKGGKYREIPLKQEVIETIKEYMETERKQNKFKESSYLILTQRAGRAHRDAVLKMLKRIGKKLGIKMYPHKFRHTFCSMLLKRGVPITTVSKLAGHSNIRTTSDYYINTSKKEKREAVELL
ncbi:MAG: integrase/recombinase XerD [Thermosediminibacterales bacterium]|nr:integrase/recombinase XerD [Thermosediminibacterales bacterium]MDK2836616.1 integrase/recombinase XerD [Thermosediminibacterales bacterium]